MTQDDLLTLASRVVAEETDNPVRPLTLTTTASDVPGWDSLAQVRIIYALEGELGASIDIDRANEAPDLGALIAIVEEALG